VADVVERKAGLLPPFVHVHPDDDVRQAIESLREYDVSQLPVLSAEPPVMAAEVVGSIVERDLLDALVTGRARPQDAVAGLMSPPLPMVGSGEPISAAVAALGQAGAALVLVDGKPAGMITRQDVLTYLSGHAS
jgi:cystathionine beta-synthase